VSAAVIAPPAPIDLRLAMEAGPELLEAARAAVQVMRRQLETLLEIAGGWDDGVPPTRSIDPVFADDVAELEAAIEAAELAILKATRPLSRLTAEQQAAIIARFPPPYLEDLRHG
jgi:hypothetical protein